ncbi:Paired amphipathic helix protein Sin3a [Halotydeus destructor]|nr:Paired amphipathic helix protein Sin3a [Halotydeus destructor]
MSWSGSSNPAQASTISSAFPSATGLAPTAAGGDQAASGQVVSQAPTGHGLAVQTPSLRLVPAAQANSNTVGPAFIAKGAATVAVSSQPQSWSSVQLIASCNASGDQMNSASSVTGATGPPLTGGAVQFATTSAVVSNAKQVTVSAAAPGAPSMAAQNSVSGMPGSLYISANAISTGAAATALPLDQSYSGSVAGKPSTQPSAIVAPHHDGAGANHQIASIHSHPVSIPMAHSNTVIAAVAAPGHGTTTFAVTPQAGPPPAHTPVLSGNAVQLTVKASPATLRSVNIIQETKTIVQQPSSQQVVHRVVPITDENQRPSQVANASTVSNGGLTNSALSAGSQQQFQRLKVEDALSYLDQVKFRFNNQPQVYNDFLDIMKEFKSQSIDTPGVIHRVSTLFKGHPELIVGFNTFLPPGYKIEMKSGEQVSVSMPHNTIVLPSSLTASSVPIHFTTNPPPDVVNQTINTGQVTTTVLQPIGSGKNSAFTASNAISAITVARPNALPSVTTQNESLPVAHAPRIVQSTVQTNAIHNVAAAANGVPPTTGTQPVEFNHAINYVNKIKLRFQGQPEVYKQFLEILHAYQKEQKNIKEGKQPENKSLSESEVYQQVAKLFKNQEDLLQEFGQFLPDANSGTGFGLSGTISAGLNLTSTALGTNSSLSTAISAAQHVDNLAAAHRAANNDHGAIVKKPLARSGTAQHFNQNTTVHGVQSMKRTASSNQPPFSGGNREGKRPKMTSLKDVSMAEAGKYGSLNEFAFFDKVRKALRSTDVYENFLRCLVMYNHEIVSRSELVLLVTPFLTKSPELLKWLKEFLGCKGEGALYANSVNNNSAADALPHRVVGIRDRDRTGSEVGMEIDYATCKRYGASYRALPKNYPQPKCSGRTPLCYEVLNDTWVSFPSWSEDSTFVTSKKTQYEEHISKCEDERYELDVVIETNLATIRVLETVQKKLSRMTPEERNKFKLDENLGGTSATIHQRSIRRIYGDKSAEIIEGLKKNSAVAVPLVLRRLKAKEEEWREAQKSFNKIWREQNERYYLKSLDHQGISFKQNDIKNLRSKNLLNEIETIFEERHEQNEEQSNGSADGPNAVTGPHMTLTYKDKSMIDEACNLIIHHVKRQTSVHKEDKQKIKQLMKHFIPDLFAVPRGDLSDDEMDDTDHDQDEAPPKPKVKSKTTRNGALAFKSQNGVPESTPVSREPTADEYSLFFVNNNWYLFFRLHSILCERLTKMHERAVIIAAEEDRDKLNRKESTAIALRLKPKSEIDTNEYFPAFVDMIKQVLDGNLDGNQYEDMLREMFGIHAYIGFTMDKVVQNIVRQLQHIVCDEPCSQCTDIYAEEMKATDGLATGGLVSTQHIRLNHEMVYQKKAEQVLTEENCFKLLFYRKDLRMTIELLDTEGVDSDDGTEIERWSEYVEKYVKDDDTISDELKDRLSKKPVFLPRNIPLWRLKGDRNQDDYVESTSERSNQPKQPTKRKERTATETDRRSSPQRDFEGSVENSLEISDGTQCRFNVNNYKMVFVVDSECFMYRRNSLPKARQSHKKVTQQLNSRFSEYQKNWLTKLKDEDSKRCDDWFMGRTCEDDHNDSDGRPIKLTRTKRVVHNDEETCPYKTYYRYKVEEKS